MGAFIQSVVLSDVMIFSIMAAAALAITGYAFTRREYSGYALGWLGGLFLIILFSTLTPAAPLDPGLETGAPVERISFMATFIPGMAGLLVGFGAIAVMGMTHIHTYHIVRALTTAAVLCLVLASGYLMLLSPFAVRLAIAVFVLGVGISALFYAIIARRQSRVVRLDEPVDTEAMASEAIIDAPVANRVQRIRQRFREGRQVSEY